MKRIALTAAAVLAAAFLLVLSRLPAKRIALPPSSWQSPIAIGGMHIHTGRSDGSGTPEEVATAAARAGLNFIVLTDHGDGTRQPDSPQYRSRVLCIEAVELSTDQGHYIALGLAKAPYPLGGEPRDVVEDVARLGGFGIVAHPDSRKPGLQWHDWTAPFDGLEWLNADSERREESYGRLVRALGTYPFRPVETIGSLLDRPDQTLRRWDALNDRRHVVGVAGTDAHARVGWQDDDTRGYRRGWFVRFPSYEASLRTFALRVNLDRPLSGDAAADAARLISAIRAGHVFTGVDAIASPAAIEFTAKSDRGSAAQGDVLEAGGPVNLAARVNAPASGVITLRKDGTLLTQHPLPELKYEAPAGPGVYRVEVYLSTAPGNPPIPWIVSNPIYVKPAGWGKPITQPVPPATDQWGIQGGPWHAEQSAGSAGQLIAHEPPNASVDFSYRLAGGDRAGQYAALVLSVGNGLTGHSRLAFQAEASQPMRLSVQARRPAGERWQRSVYLDQGAREVVIPFSDMTRVGDAPSLHFVPGEIDTLLFVVDTTNTAPGSEGKLVLRNLRVEH